MGFIVRVYHRDQLYSIDLTCYDYATIGSAPDDTIRLDAVELGEKQIVFNCSERGITIKGKHLTNSKGSRISSDTLEVGKKYTIEIEPPAYISVHPKQNDGGKLVELQNRQELTIGRSEKNDIVLRNMRTSAHHCKIYKTDGLYKIKDLDSTNGTYVNGRRIEERLLKNGDIINISVYQMMMSDHSLSFFNVGNDMDLNIRPEEQDEINIEIKKQTDGGTISVFSVKQKNDALSVFEEYERPACSNGTMSVFDIGIHVKK